MGDDRLMTSHPLIVPARFCGPPVSGNGGWAAGSLAASVEGCPEDRGTGWPTVEVSLRMPPPLDTPMPVTQEDGAATATHEGSPVAVARCAETEPEPVEPVPYDEAVAASASYPGHVAHPFATCFVCGTAREAGDGLRIFPGKVEPVTEGRTRVAAPWTPDPSLAEDFHHYGDEQPRASLAATWAALDCTGGWAGDFGERLMVLARMTARVDALPVIGEPHVVVGEARGTEGRKTWSATTLYDADGRAVGAAEHLWISVDPAAFS